MRYSCTTCCGEETIIVAAASARRGSHATRRCPRAQALGKFDLRLSRDGRIYALFNNGTLMEMFDNVIKPGPEERILPVGLHSCAPFLPIARDERVAVLLGLGSLSLPVGGSLSLLLVYCPLCLSLFSPLTHPLSRCAPLSAAFFSLVC